jgi:SOS regulatory protein LexA
LENSNDNVEFREYLKSIREEKGFSVRRLAEISGISHTYLSQVETGKRGVPSPDILRKLYKPLDIEYNELMKRAGHITTDLSPETKKLMQMNELSELIDKAKDLIFPLVSDEKGVVTEEAAEFFLEGYAEDDKENYKKLVYEPYFFDSLFEELPISDKILFLNALIKDYTDRGISLDEVFDIRKKQDENSLNVLRVPVLGHIAAGLPIFADEHIEEWTEIPNMWNLKDGETFVLKVKGDSMIGSRIFDGDKVIVKIQSNVENGEIAAVNVNGDEATLKRVKRTETGQTILYPDNPLYDPIFITNEKARIIGKVVQVMFEPKKVF